MAELSRPLAKHLEWRGKIEITPRAPVNTRDELAVAYTPGVSAPCLEIKKNEAMAYDYTGKGNMVAVITDGTSVLGLGDIGPAAAMPVMEGKCVLFKRFAGIDAFPICIDSKDPRVITDTIVNISKSFGGINLEDISAPRCFEIEAELKRRCGIPVFHDDQHGTAVVAAAGLINALRFTGKKKGSLKIVINGAGAAGISVAKLFLRMNFGSITLCGSKGIIYDGAPYNNKAQQDISRVTNTEGQKGNLTDAIRGADIFIGVSKPGVLTKEMIRLMNGDPVIFAMANPIPEIMPDLAKEAGASVVGTGRSDFPNQINNVLAFPGIFKGALAVKAGEITDSMKEAAAEAIAAVIPDGELRADYILPDVFDMRVAPAVADAVAKEAVKLGIQNRT